MSEFALSVKWDLLEHCFGDGMDLGCGDARPHDWMTGIDHRAGTTGRGPNLLRDVRNMGMYASESQDYLFSSYLLNELPDWPAVLAGWWRLLKPNGKLILFLPAKDACNPKALVDAMAPLKPWQLVDARLSGESFFHVYQKTDSLVEETKPDPEKICAVVKLGAHGDALWASSVFPHLKDQGFYTVLYTQATGEEVLRHDPHIDKLICFESRVPMQELGELFLWIEHRYKHSRILVECVEGTLLPSPQKIQYHFPLATRQKLMNHNYLQMHHEVARVPMEPRQKFYPSPEEKAWANTEREKLQPFVVVLVPNGSSVTKMWPYAGEFVKFLLNSRDDVSVVVIGDLRGTVFVEHPRLSIIGHSWMVRQAMTFCQLTNVVVGQETGMLNSVAFEPDVRKVVLLTHSTRENLTRDWPNTASIRTNPACADGGACHRLHYDWQYCTKDQYTQAAACQTAISALDVLREVDLGIVPQLALRAA